MKVWFTSLSMASALLVISAFGIQQPVAGQVAAAGDQIVEVARQVSPAVVSVTRTGGAGSGVIISEDGIILTNNHVVGNANRVAIRLIDGRQFTGVVLGRDPGIDIAIVRIDAPDLAVAPLGDSDALQVGQAAIAIGNPLGLERTVTSGIISAINRSPRGFLLEGLVQTDAAINPGNSGGPLLDIDGEVIGINTAIIRGQADVPAVGLGFAVPINLAVNVVEQILTTGRVVRAYMGISAGDIEPEMAQQLNLPVNEGVIIIEVAEGSPAHRAGLQIRDIVTAIDGSDVHRMADMRTVLRAKVPGEHIRLSVHRDGSVRDITITLGEASP
jgi:serine protease Do